MLGLGSTQDDLCSSNICFYTLGKCGSKSLFAYLDVICSSFDFIFPRLGRHKPKLNKAELSSPYFQPANLQPHTQNNFSANLQSILTKLAKNIQRQALNQLMAKLSTDQPELMF